MVRFCSRDKRFKTPFGALATDETVSISFPVAKSIAADEVVLVYRNNSGGGDVRLKLKKSGTDGDYDVFTLKFSYAEAGVFFYRFEISAAGNTLFVGRDKIGGRAIIGDWLPEWQQTVYDKSYTAPSCLEGGVIYQIFPDRFNRVGDMPTPPYGVKKDWNQELTIVDDDGVYRANDFYGGNIKGIISRLDYLAALGVTMIYLNPIFLSHSNHRYDTADYLKIDPIFGTEEDFSELILKAGFHGIGIILDGVFNHTGADSVYFNKFNHFPSLGAYQSKNSPYYDWYTFNKFPDNYNCWWGVTVVPTVRRDAAGYHKLIAGSHGVIEKWTEMGVKGWRLDVVDELSDSFVAEIRQTLKKVDPGAVLIGEVWEDASIKESYSEKRKYLFGEELDGVMNYPFKEAILSVVADGCVEAFTEKVMTIVENYPAWALNNSMTLIGTHDTVRALNALGHTDGAEFISKADKLAFRMSEGQYAYARDRLLVGSAIQFFLPGVPSIYYGDEIGMQGFEDPINRRPMPQSGDELILSHYKMLGAVRRMFKQEFIHSDTEIIRHSGYFEIKRGRVSLLVNTEHQNAMIGESKIEFYSGENIESLGPMKVAVVLNDNKENK